MAASSKAGLGAAARGGLAGFDNIRIHLGRIPKLSSIAKSILTKDLWQQVPQATDTAEVSLRLEVVLRQGTLDPGRVLHATVVARLAR